MTSESTECAKERRKRVCTEKRLQGNMEQRKEDGYEEHRFLVFKYSLIEQRGPDQRLYSCSAYDLCGCPGPVARVNGHLLAVYFQVKSEMAVTALRAQAVTRRSTGNVDTRNVKVSSHEYRADDTNVPRSIRVFCL